MQFTVRDRWFQHINSALNYITHKEHLLYSKPHNFISGQKLICNSMEDLKVSSTTDFDHNAIDFET